MNRNRKIIAGGVVVAALLAVAAVRELRKPTDVFVDTAKQLAVDECLAVASSALNSVFTEACRANPAIEKDSERCASWSSAAIFEFMNKQPEFPAFKDALAAWERKAQECYAR